MMMYFTMSDIYQSQTKYCWLKIVLKRRDIVRIVTTVLTEGYPLGHRNEADSPAGVHM